ncbi:hypothetical protein OF83DRAFT_1179372 [Amylostereum chailletii]|nr:hypothetical protein OF83DRAFT_1179372 [Amylostereum chailletii]
MSMYRAPSPRVPSPSPGYAPSPSYVRGASPSPGAMRSVSPIPMAMSPSMQPLPMGASPAQIAPGTITYTTSYAPNGSLQYHTFKAVPVSYQIPDAHGVLRVQEGMQWIPADATSVLPQNAMPASSDFASAWKKGLFKDNDHALKEWQRDEEKRRRKEEKEAAKRIERARREREKEERRAHEKELRRRSGNYGGVPAAYGTPAGSPYAPYASPVADLEHQFKSTAISGNRRSVYADPNRPPSPYHPPGAPMAPPSPVSTAANPGYGPAAGFYPPASPYRGGGALPGGYPADQPSLSRSRAPSPAPGPYGHRSRAPSPVPGAGIYGGPRSRAPSPVPGAAPYGQPGYPPAQPVAAPVPYQHDQQQRLAPPDGFGRPPNLAQSYTYFETMKIQDMEDFYDNLPPMPLVLVPHDVYHPDWIRFMEDLALAWAGKLPANGASRRSQMAAELVEVWNNAFFQQRGVEAVLYKGRERRSGPAAGTIDRHLPGFDTESDSDSDSSLSDDSDLSESDRYRSAAYGGHYGRHDDRDSKRRQREKKEKKRKQKEKAKRKAEKTYSLYLTCIPTREAY